LQSFKNLALFFLWLRKNRNGDKYMKNGFTLAEVFLTLAIIGVTATLIISVVVTKVVEGQYIVTLI